MTQTSLRRIIGLGALTGLRSMAGPAALGFERGGILGRVTGALAAGEMAADKTSVVGDRIDPGPLTGRALIGAAVGGIAAHQGHSSVVLGTLLGASAAIVAAHLGFHARKRLPGSTAVSGLIEDAVVVMMGQRLMRPSRLTR